MDTNTIKKEIRLALTNNLKDINLKINELASRLETISIEKEEIEKEILTKQGEIDFVKEKLLSLKEDL